MSDARTAKPFALIAYLLVAAAIVFEVAVVWWMLHPDVPEDYRAFYIDLSTTCLNQPVSGDYALGTRVSFLPDDLDRAKPLKVCGWTGPAGDGTHAQGTSSRLRFALPPETGSLRLTLEMIALEREGYPQQRTDVVVNGETLASETVLPARAGTFTVDIPADVVKRNPGALEVTLTHPHAIKMGANDSNTYWRSIKLLSAELSPL